MEFFDVGKLMDVIKEYNMNKMRKWIDDEDPIASDRKTDNTHIRDILLISFGCRIAYQVIIIMNVVYFIAIFWWILAVC